MWKRNGVNAMTPMQIKKIEKLLPAGAIIEAYLAATNNHHDELVSIIKRFLAVETVGYGRELLEKEATNLLTKIGE